ncbi:MAG TPA: hypothetical protein EYP67_05290 [Methanosarcinales archaeon]|nr:hypothetical protein [Methanosarcinales archaeon]
MGMTQEEVEGVLIRPLGRLMQTIGSSIADAQRAMDENSIAIQKAIEQAIDNGEIEYDIQAPWYHFPEVDIELKMALSMTEKEEVDKKGRVRGYMPVILAAPLNATYKNAYNYDVRGSSQLKAKIASIPPATKLSE